MKPLAVILSSAVVVVAALLIYAGLVRSGARPTESAKLDDGESRSDDPGAASARMAVSPRREHERRLANLESALAELRIKVGRVAKLAQEAAAERHDPVHDPDAPLDEGELDVLRLQMEELERRKEARRQSTMVRRKLEQLGVKLSETEHAAALDRMVRFQVAVSQLWTRVREEAISDQALIADEYTSLTDEAAKDVRALLPADKAAAVIKGFLTVGPPGHRPPR